MSYQSAACYSRNLLSGDACGLLAGDPESTPIDVRTQAERGYVVIPEVLSKGKAALFLEGQSHPSMQVDERFIARLSTTLETVGIECGARLLFICRSDVPSAPRRRRDGRCGVRPCFNVAEWFRGAANTRRHRSAITGSKAGLLPWVQT
jgi:hypothetical protein